MDILRFSNAMRRSGLLLFTCRQAERMAPGYAPGLLRLQLHQWRSKGCLRRLKRGLYQLSRPEELVIPDFHVANRLYEPSYVSLDSALSHFQILPETAAQVTSVTSKPTRRFHNTHGLFLYFTIRPKAYTGYSLTRMQGVEIRLAEPEKALMDRLYAGLRRGESLDQISDRWDRRAISKFDRGKLGYYASLFGASRIRLTEFTDALLR